LQKIHIYQKNIVRFIKEHRTIKVLHLFRHYSALIVVISCAILVSATNLAAGKESSGFLFGYLGSTEDNYENPLANKMSLQTNKKNDLNSIELAHANIAPDPNFKEEEEAIIIQGDGALVGLTGPVRKDPEEDGGVKIYEVQNGDTVGAIATKYGITINTILWANDIDNVDSIMPGDKIFILPVAGLSHIVKKGDSLDSIASKYKADKDKIIAFNDLPANGEIKEGQSILIPGGQKEIPVPVRPTQSGIATRQYEPFSTSGKRITGANGTGHRFPYGYCTWYVAQKKHVPWGGNAGTWLYNAKAMGYATGKTPRVGSIMVTSESWWGHVAIVESVKGNTFTVSEMNYKGWAKKSYRTITVGSRFIKGFIY